MAVELKEYAVPGLLACLLHGLVASSPHLLGFSTEETRAIDVFEPKVLTTTLVQFQPINERPLIAPPETPRFIEEPPDSLETAAPDPLEAEEQARLRQIRQQELLADLREQAFTETLSNECNLLRRGNRQGVGQYISAIYLAFVAVDRLQA